MKKWFGRMAISLEAKIIFDACASVAQCHIVNHAWVPTVGPVFLQHKIFTL